MNIENFESCRHCGEAISYNVTWPTGRAKWQARHDVFGWWSFCPAVDGNPHEPVRDVTPEPDRRANVSVPDGEGREMELDPDAPTVCIEHGAFVPCRKAGQHFTSQDPYWVKAVRDYQTSRDPNLTWEPASEYTLRKIQTGGA